MHLVFRNTRACSILLVLLLALSSSAVAQKEGNIWYFGNKAGLDFNGDYPLPLHDGQMIAPAGCASISDSTGQLLFYSNGRKIWNRNHELMQFGTDLFGDSTATQSANILQHPEDSSKYYLFTNRRYPGPDTTYYGGHFYLIDFKNNSLGKIRLEESSTQPEQGITPLATEKFMAIPYGPNVPGTNGKKGYWIIAHQTNSNNFMVFQLDSTLRPHSTQQQGSSNGSAAAGYLKANLQGNRFALACSYWVQIFDFNNRTGDIRYRFHLYGDSKTNRNSYQYQTYGLAFSPSGRYLFGTGWNGGVIYRWDMSITNAADMRETTKYLRSGDEVVCGALQLATDGKIYVALNGADYLGVIQTPDNAFPDYQEHGVRLVNNETYESATSAMGLPNALPPTWKPPPFFVNYTCLGEKTLFYFTDTAGLTGTPYWDIYMEGFSTPLTRVPSTSSYNGSFEFPDTGNYRVEFNATYGAEEFIHNRNVRITAPKPITWPDTTLFCSGNDLVLDAGYGAFYEWDDTDERNRIRIVKEQQYLLQEYRVRVKDYNGCVSWDTIVVEKKFSPEVARVETTKALCGQKNGSATVFPVGDIEDFDYYWEEDSTETSNTLSNISGGKYHVHVINPKTTCARITEITVPELGGADVQIIASTDSIVCPGTPVLLTALNADAYEWLNPVGETNNQVWVTPFTDTVFSVKAFSQDDQGNECTTYADFHLWIHEISYPALGPDQSACQGDSISLELNDIFSEYRWSNGASGSFQIFRESLNNLVLEVSDENGCMTSDTINIVFNPAPVLQTEATKALCGEVNGSATVYPDGIIEEYLYRWEEDTTVSANSLQNIAAGLYHVQVISTLTGCSSSTEILVEELGGPDTQILPSIDSVVCPGTPITLTAINGDAFEWIYPAGNNQAVITVAPLSQTTYTVRGISTDDQGNECSTYVEYTVEVLPVQAPDLGADLSACEGDTLHVEAPSGYESYFWSTGLDSTTISITESINPLVLIVTNEIGCSSSDSIKLTFNPYPEVDLGADLELCTNQPIILEGGTGDQYVWNTGAQSQSIETMESGTYSVKISTSGCSRSDTVEVVIRNPDLTIIDSLRIKDVTCFGGNDGSIEIFYHGPGDEYAFSINGDQDYQYNNGIFSRLPAGDDYSIWLLQDSVCPKEYTQTIGIIDADSIWIDYRIKPPSCPVCDDGQITLKEIFGGHPPFEIEWSDLGKGMNRIGLSEGLYAVTITDSSQCHRTIPIQLEQQFLIPNAFTPNGDGVNDTWKIPVLRNYDHCLVSVLDRNGIVVYKSPTGYPEPWDGLVNGKPLPSGSYYYIIQYLENKQPITGNLTLLR